MPHNGLGDLLWFYAFFLGGLSCVAIAVAHISWARFRVCLGAPLTCASGEVWAETSMFWYRSGLGMASISILCTVLSRIV